MSHSPHHQPGCRLHCSCLQPPKPDDEDEIPTPFLAYVCLLTGIAPVIGVWWFGLRAAAGLF